jgi:erythritol kinase
VGRRFVAVDAGTSAIKAVLFDDRGRELRVARRAVQVLRPQPTWSEQDMTEVWERVVDVIRDVAVGEPEIALLVVTGQGDGCWLVDEQGRPTGPAPLWNDGRASAYVDRWQHDGTLNRGYALNGSISFPGLANAVLRWLGDYDPERLRRSASLLSCAGWLALCLTGRVCAEISDASAPFLDAATGGYSAALLELYGLSSLERLLPPIVSGPSALAPLRAEAADVLGLPAGTPVFLAPYDVASSAIGMGAREAGQAVAVLGTTLFTGVITDRADEDSAPSGARVALGLPGRFLRFFPTLTGVETLTWGAALLGLDGPVEFAELAASGDPGANGLTMLPYLSPAGERAPFLDPRARGSILNLSLEHGRADLARAALEALSMVVRDCLEATPAAVSELRLGGGGANSAFWCQLIADVTGVRTVRDAATEAGARGAVIAALIASGDSRAVEEFESPGGPPVSWDPDPDRSAFYSRQYERFLELRSEVSRTWPELAGGPE